ncbi:hypothetical protein [Lacinutrix algicola]|uniref:hypothetical protein n=1 Tax=Lacinutrix algicola TaxID=342954 RepID=UPI0006E3FEAC|nr:hypothetical protein [Lacinutrix algicola]
MKYLLSVLVFFTMLFSFAQDSTTVKVKTPKIVSKLIYGKTISIDDLELKFISLESDSRCPTGVQCVWAGEAIAIVDVYKNGQKLEQKKITFPNRKKILTGNLFSSETLNISGLNIAPYPKHNIKIKPEDYYIQLDIRN